LKRSRIHFGFDGQFDPICGNEKRQKTKTFCRWSLDHVEENSIGKIGFSYNNSKGFPLFTSFQFLKPFQIHFKFFQKN
jgi:hypothetical protein